MDSYLKIVLSDENCFTAIAKAIFNRADEDKSNFIDPQEFRKMMLGITEEYNLPTPSDQTIIETMKKVDLDKNGTVEFDEFKEFLRKIFQQVIIETEEGKE
jgi:Ca2+-binding EF-hand superfamily protein